MEPLFENLSFPPGFFFIGDPSLFPQSRAHVLLVSDSPEALYLLQPDLLCVTWTSPGLARDFRPTLLTIFFGPAWPDICFSGPTFKAFFRYPTLFYLSDPTL